MDDQISNRETTEPAPVTPIEPPATDAAAPPADSSVPPATVVSEARQRANRLNAQKSTGPKTTEGKRRSSLNATRHAILSQVVHFPEEELKSYTGFCESIVHDLAPVGALETELAKTCADLQYRLHRVSAAEHNLFAIGLQENGNSWETGHAESHTALALAETLRQSPSLATISIYEQRMHRRYMQTIKQLREIQADRRARQSRDLEEMKRIATHFPEQAENMEPAALGFVCSKEQWIHHWYRFTMADPSGARIDLLDDPRAMRRNSFEIASRTLLATSTGA